MTMLPKIEQVTVTAKTRTLSGGFRTVIRRRGKKFCFRVPWIIEPAQDLKAQHGLDLEEELIKMLADEIRKDIEDTRND